jgi:predicted secreted protein
MLQRSAIDRWVQSDHILIHPCPETLYLRARALEM